MPDRGSVALPLVGVGDRPGWRREVGGRGQMLAHGPRARDGGRVNRQGSAGDGCRRRARDAGRQEADLGARNAKCNAMPSIRICQLVGETCRAGNERSAAAVRPVPAVSEGRRARSPDSDLGRQSRTDLGCSRHVREGSRQARVRLEGDVDRVVERAGHGGVKRRRKLRVRSSPTRR